VEVVGNCFRPLGKVIVVTGHSNITFKELGIAAHSRVMRRGTLSRIGAHQLEDKCVRMLIAPMFTTLIGDMFQITYFGLGFAQVR